MKVLPCSRTVVIFVTLLPYNLSLVLVFPFKVADLICYSTSAEGLLHVLKEADLITWGKWQRIESML